MKKAAALHLAMRPSVELLLAIGQFYSVLTRGNAVVVAELDAYHDDGRQRADEAQPTLWPDCRSALRPFRRACCGWSAGMGDDFALCRSLVYATELIEAGTLRHVDIIPGPAADAALEWPSRQMLIFAT